MGRKATKTLEERQQVLKIKSFETTLKDKIEEKLLEEKRIPSHFSKKILLTFDWKCETLSS